MRTRPWLLKAAAAGVFLVSLPVAAVVGVGALSGDDEEQVPPDLVGTEPTVDVTPEPPGSPYPTRDPTFPTIIEQTPPIPDYPDFVEISGVQIPIPEGAHYLQQGPGGELRPLHWVWFGDSNYRETPTGGEPVGVQFDEYGLLLVSIQRDEEAAFAPTLDALWMLTQQVAEPSPESLSLVGETIPLPEGSYYVTEETGLDLNPIVYIVRYHYSAFMFDSHGLFNVSVSTEDAAVLETTLAAVTQAVNAEA